MGYIIQNLNTHLNEPPEDNRYAGFNQRVILMTLKMVILALDRAAGRRSAQVYRDDLDSDSSS